MEEIYRNFNGVLIYSLLNKFLHEEFNLDLECALNLCPIHITGRINNKSYRNQQTHDLIIIFGYSYSTSDSVSKVGSELNVIFMLFYSN